MLSYLLGKSTCCLVDHNHVVCFILSYSLNELPDRTEEEATKARGRNVASLQSRLPTAVVVEVVRSTESAGCSVVDDVLKCVTALQQQQRYTRIFMDEHIISCTPYMIVGCSPRRTTASTKSGSRTKPGS